MPIDWSQAGQFNPQSANLPGMFSGALSQVHGASYPGGPSFGIAPQTAMANQSMQNAMFGTQAAQSKLFSNLGLFGDTLQWNRQFNPSPMDFLSTGLAGVGALDQFGRLGQDQRVNQLYGAGIAPGSMSSPLPMLPPGMGNGMPVPNF